jgi:hypothetical protein
MTTPFAFACPARLHSTRVDQPPIQITVAFAQQVHQSTHGASIATDFRVAASGVLWPPAYDCGDQSVGC